MQMDTQELLREFYEWQINNLNVESGARKLKVELDKLGLTYLARTTGE